MSPPLRSSPWPAFTRATPWAAAGLLLGPVVVQLGEELIRVGNQGGETRNDERAHFAVPEGGLGIRLQVGRRTDSQGGITVLATHARTLSQVACHFQDGRDTLAASHFCAVARRRREKIAMAQRWWTLAKQHRDTQIADRGHTLTWKRVPRPTPNHVLAFEGICRDFGATVTIGSGWSPSAKISGARNGPSYRLKNRLQAIEREDEAA